MQFAFSYFYFLMSQKRFFNFTEVFQELDAYVLPPLLVVYLSYPNFIPIKRSFWLS